MAVREAQTFKFGGASAWKGKHAKLREQLDLPTPQSGWSSEHTLLGVPRSAERVRDCIDLCYQASVKKDPHLNVRNLVVDVSQDGSRMAWACQLRSLTRSSAFYNFGQDRMVCAGETLTCLGFPHDLCWDDCSEACIKDLVGESFAVPCAATCLLVLVSLLPDLWSTHPFTDD